ncbi:MAG TPA: hypothetical protein VGD60_01860 [Candidatus Acidoferrales bacterium]
MPLPETIDAKYTEEQAEYLSMTPVVRQTFRAPELVDMIVQGVGKDSRKVRHILQAGTVIFRSYRYWWDGFEADPAAVDEILATYPDADPARMFSGERCTEVILESSGSPPRHSLRIKREEAPRKSGVFSFLRAGNFWDALMKFGEPGKIHYREYSYALRADVYARTLNADEVMQLAADANKQASRELRAELMGLPSVSQIVFICPR